MKQKVNSSEYTIELWVHLGGLLSTINNLQKVESLSTIPQGTLLVLSCLATSCVVPSFNITKGCQPRSESLKVCACPKVIHFHYHSYHYQYH